MPGDVAEALSGAGAVIVLPGGTVPRDGAGRPTPPFRAGDVLRVSCRFAEAEVDEATPQSVEVRWPWARVDPASRYRWNGGVGFYFDEWHLTLFRVEPDPTMLRPGDRCQVGIPPTLAHVLQVHCWYPDRDTGSLPHESVGLTLLPPGVTHGLGNLDEASYCNPYGAEPVRVELLLRPYRFLEDLDVVADREGRRWEFCRPYWWVELDRDDAREGPPERLAAPAWPLTLLRRRAGVAPTPAQAEAVVRATATGSHGQEVGCWSRLTGAEPVAAAEEGAVPREAEPDPGVVEAEFMGVREELGGRGFSEIARAYLHTRVDHRQLALAGRDFDTVPDLERLEIRLEQIASIVRELRSQGAGVLHD